MREMKGWGKVFFIGALLLTTIVMMGDSLITPAASTLYMEHPDYCEQPLLLNPKDS